LLKYLACLIGLFAIIAVAAARGEAPANQAPAQQDKAQAGSQELQTPPDGKQQPTITSPPVAQTVNVGQTASFAVTATGADLHYQWTKNRDNIVDAQSPSYTTPPTVAADNGVVFSVVVSNNSGSVKSANATLTVIVPESGSVSAPLVPRVAITLFLVVLVAFLGALIAWVQGKPDPSKSKPTDDKDLEALRITYGFWLVIGALLVTLFVLVITLSALAPKTPTTTDIVAIIGAITGVIGTLTAAFFGIQAAGAGRSQAMTMMSDHLRAQAPDGAAASKLEPSCGPHAGGTLVSISGNGFTGANAVNFGETLGTDFKNINDGLVRANSPQAPQGVDDTKVVVVFPGASPTNREVGTFYYYTIAPFAADGKNKVTIRGSDLKGANAVKFGTIPGTELTFGTGDGKDFKESSDGLSLLVVVPAGKSGDDVDVTVHFPVAAATNSFVVGKYHYD
jgi:hypothetical protein